MIRINTDNFGVVLRELRIKKGLTQEELAKGICSRQYIYLVETGKRMLSAYALQQISFKLGVDLSKYVLLSSYENPIQIEKIMKKMDLLRKNRQFAELREKVKELENTTIKKDIMVLQFIQWNKSVCQYELDKDYHRARATLISSIKLSKRDVIHYKNYSYLKDRCITQIEFSLFNSLSVVLSRLGKVNHAIEITQNLKHNLEKYTYEYESENVYAYILYNLSFYYITVDEYKKALKEVDLLISLRNQQNELYLLGEGMYHKSVILNKLDRIKEAKQMAQDALSFFRFRGNDEFVKIIAKEIKEQYGEES